MKKIEFTGTVSGDGECFCFKVDKKTFISICGEAEYRNEIEYEKSMCRDFGKKYKEPKYFLIYPHKLFGSSLKPINVTIFID